MYEYENDADQGDGKWVWFRFSNFFSQGTVKQIKEIALFLLVREVLERESEVGE